MPIVKPASVSASLSAATPRVDPRVARTLWQWFVLGAIAVVLVPAARGHSQLIGALPFWLVVAPGTALLVLYRHPLAAAWRARLVRATPRRRRRSAAVRTVRPVRGALTGVRAGVVPQRQAAR